MKETVAYQTICPRCGAAYSERPAISREDNQTPICPDCGTREALMTLGISRAEQDKIILTIHRSYEQI